MIEKNCLFNNQLVSIHLKKKIPFCVHELLSTYVPSVASHFMFIHP